MTNKKISEKNKSILEQSDSILNLFTRKKSSKAFKIFFIQIKIELESKK